MLRLSLPAVLPLFVALAVSLGISERSLTSVIDLGYTKLQGTTAANGVYQWLGVRYAQPPMGQLRFQAPQKVLGEGCLEIKNQTGTKCYGTRSSSTDPGVAGTGEDCLNMDIFVPSNATSTSRLPIYFFIPGGGFNVPQPLPDGSTLVEASGNSIIVVSINYRLSAYGFLSSSEIQSGASLNNGLKDQRLALQWIHDYISNFGGDPGRVVIGGASAGGTSAILQLAAYGGRADNLFHGIISNSQDIISTRTVDESQFQYDNLVNRTHCHPSVTGDSDTLKCLQGLNSTFLQSQNIKTTLPGSDVVPFQYYDFVKDGDFLPDYPLQLFDSGRFLKLPSIYGDVSDEGTVFTPTTLNTVDDSDSWLQAQFTTISQNQLDTLQSMYPPQPQVWLNSASFGKYFRSTATAFAYLRFICPGFLFNNATSQSGSAKSWNYHYNVNDLAQVNKGLGVPHIAEQTPLWAGANFSAGSYGGANKPINALIQQYWISFIKNLDPNPQRLKGSVEWAEWGSGQRLLVQNPTPNGSINTTVMESVDIDRKNNCATLLSWKESLRM